MTKTLYSIIGFVCAAMMCAPLVQAAPQLSIDESTFDFGYVPQQAKVSHGFWLKSVGDDTLRIVQVKTGCGCTKAPLNKTVLAPGDSTLLQVTFSTGRYKGRIAKHPKITTDAGTPPQTLTIVSHVLENPITAYPVRVEPSVLEIGAVDADMSQAVTFDLTNVTDGDLSLQLVDAPPEISGVTLPESIAPGSTESVQLRLTGKINGQRSITIQVDDASGSRFSIPVKVERAPDAVKEDKTFGRAN